MTMSRHWGYFKHETGYKSPEVILRDLITVVSEGGNLLLDIGPTPEGEFPPQSTERLHAIGAWMRVNAEALTGSSPWTQAQEIPPQAQAAPIPAASPAAKNGVAADAVNDATSISTSPELRFTAKGGDVFLFAMSWKDAVIHATSMAGMKVKRVEMLGSTERVAWTQEGGGLSITLPRAASGAAIPIYVFRVQG